MASTFDIFGATTIEAIDAATAEHGLGVLATIGPGGKTFVNSLVASGDYDLALHCISEKNFDANTKDRDGRSVLFYACKFSYKAALDFVKKVVENHSADVNMVDEFGDTPLHYACQYADAERASEMVDYLISRGAKIGAVAKDGTTPFLVAAGFGGSGLKVAKKLASLDPALIRAVDAKGRDTLHHACDGGGKRDLVEWLLELKDETTNQPLFPMQGDWLITLFGFGATDKTAGLVELFISRGATASVDSKGNNLVHLAAGFGVGSAALVGLAVENLNLDVNKANSEGLTPLHLACGFGCGVSGVISCLIELKASVNSKDSAGDTPLHHAIANYDTLSHKEATLELLVKAGADIHQANNSGFSPLEAAKGSDCASDIIPIILGEKSATAVEEDPVIDLDFNFNDSDSDSGESKLLDFEW